MHRHKWKAYLDNETAVRMHAGLPDAVARSKAFGGMQQVEGCVSEGDTLNFNLLEVLNA